MERASYTSINRIWCVEMLFWYVKKYVVIFAVCLSVFGISISDTRTLIPEQQTEVTGSDSACSGDVFSFPTGANATVGEAQLSMHGLSYCLMDGGNGRVLREKEMTKPLANASTTKILTCILALERRTDNQVVAASQRAACQPKVRLGMKEGEQFYVEDLLYAMMLESENDCAVAIAEAIGGTVEQFAFEMNEKAKEIGCRDTYFITPNGLDQEDTNGAHHTTAEDLCRIMKYCAFESPCAEEFRKIAATKEYSFCDLEGTKFQSLNKNSFLFEHEGIIAGKTGYTSDAGYCYVFAYEKDNTKLCGVTLGAGWPPNKSFKWEDAAVLLDYGCNQCVPYPIVLQKPPVAICENVWKEDTSWKEYGKDIKVDTYFDSQETTIIPLVKEGEKIIKEFDLQQEKFQEIEENQVLGEYRIIIEEEEIFSCKIRAKETTRSWDFPTFFRKLFDLKSFSEKINKMDGFT